MRSHFFTRKRILRAVAILSLGCFGYMFLRLGPGQVWDLFRRISWFHWLILLTARLVYWMIRSVNWGLVLRNYGFPAPVVRLFMARVAGHAVNYLTPSARVGGEAVRILILDGIDRSVVLASAVVDKTIEFLVTFLMIGIGVLIAIGRFSLPASQQVILVSVTAGAALVLFGLFYIQKRGLFTHILDGLVRLRLRFDFLEKRRAGIHAAETRISDFYRESKPLFSVIFLFYVAMMLLWAMEIRLTFVFLGAPEVGWLKCFLLVMLGSLSYLIPALPASLGVYELTYLSLFALLGIDLQSGLAVILVRRVLGLVWAGLGLFPMLGRRKPVSQA